VLSTLSDALRAVGSNALPVSVQVSGQDDVLLFFDKAILDLRTVGVVVVFPTPSSIQQFRFSRLGHA
jgi:hypothetical protein